MPLFTNHTEAVGMVQGVDEREREKAMKTFERFSAVETLNRVALQAAGIVCEKLDKGREKARAVLELKLSPDKRLLFLAEGPTAIGVVNHDRLKQRNRRR